MVEFDEKTHTYTVDGVVLPSVTHIIRFLNYDTATTAKSWLRDVAADRGTRVHKYTMLYDFGESLTDIDFDCVGYLKAYMEFCRDVSHEWTAIEKPLGDVTLGFAGTVDRHGIVYEREAVVDIKTGTKINAVAVAAQLSGYDVLLGHNDDLDHYCLQLCKDGTYKFTKHESGYRAFASCLYINKALEKGKKHG